MLCIPCCYNGVVTLNFTPNFLECLNLGLNKRNLASFEFGQFTSFNANCRQPFRRSRR